MAGPDSAEIAAPNEDGDSWQALSEIPEADGAVAWAMVEASPDALVMADEHGVIELVNSQAETLFGYDRVELLGKPVEMLLPERYAEVHLAHRTRFRVAPEVRAMGSGMDLRALRRDGTEVPVEVSLSPLQVQGKLRIIAAVRDVSNRVAAEAQALMIQSTIDAAHDGVFMFPADNAMTFAYVNKGAIDQTGYTQAELLAMTPLHIKPEFTKALFLETIAPLVAGEIDRLTFTTMHRRKDGRDVPVEIILEYPDSAPEAAERLMVAFVRDVTERVEAERRLAASEERFRAAFDSGPVPMGVMTVTPTTEPVLVRGNQALAELLGYDVDALSGLTYAELIHPDDLSADEDRLARVRGGHRSEDGRVRRFLRSNGTTVWVRSHSAPLGQDGEETTAIAHLVDITSEIEAAQANDRRQALKVAVSEVRHVMLEQATREQGMKLICQQARAILDASTVLVLTSTGSDHELKIEAASGVSNEYRDRLVFRSNEGVVGTVFSTGQAEFTDATDPRVTAVNAQVIDEERAGTLLLAPLHDADGISGVLLVTRQREAKPLGVEDLAALEQFASAAVVAIELSGLRETRAHMELLDDRERIGRDMHDKVIGRLFASGMTMQATLSRVTDPIIKERLGKVVDDIDEAIKEIRTAVFGLRAGADWGKGNKGQILAMAADQNDSLGFEPTVDFDGPIDDLSDIVINELLATMREAFTNIAKHAHPTEVTLNVAIDHQQLRMTIVDNGAGFDATAADGSCSLSGNGLANITARAEMLGGHATITSSLGAGTTVEWAIPVT